MKKAVLFSLLASVLLTSSNALAFKFEGCIRFSNNNWVLVFPNSHGYASNHLLVASSLKASAVMFEGTPRTAPLDTTKDYRCKLTTAKHVNAPIIGAETIGVYSISKCVEMDQFFCVE